MVEIDPSELDVTTHYLPGERAMPDELDKIARRIAEDEMLGEILDVVPGPVVVLNEFRQIIAANDQLLSALGLDSLSTLLGLRPGEALDCVAVPEAPSGCGTSEKCVYCGLVNTVVESVKSEAVASGECSIRGRDGSAMEWEVTARPKRIGGDRIVFVGLRDIAGEKRRALLERTFFHDVLNTAGGIRGLLSVVEEGVGDTEGTELRMNLVALADDLIDEIRSHRVLCTAEAGDLVVRDSLVDLPGLLDRLRALYARHAVAQNRSIVLVPPPARSIRTDEALLRRVLGNMLKNALEATPAGGTVHLSASFEGEVLVIEVRNPTVMSEKVRQQIFNRSFTTKGAGRGIGTYSMKLLGERYLGGEVSFESHESAGTRFFIRLTGAGAPVGSPVEEEAMGRDGTGLRVLVADDSAVNRLVVRHRLKSFGCEVEEAGNGRDALAALARSPRDVVILDLEMPELGGLEAARRIREGEAGTNRHIRIIALTGSAGPEERASCLAAGMDAVLEKPAGLEDLELAVVG